MFLDGRLTPIAGGLCHKPVPLVVLTGLGPVSDQQQSPPDILVILKQSAHEIVLRTIAQPTDCIVTDRAEQHLGPCRFRLLLSILPHLVKPWRPATRRCRGLAPARARPRDGLS
jgi:hypothetical protein